MLYSWSQSHIFCKTIFAKLPRRSLFFDLGILWFLVSLFVGAHMDIRDAHQRSFPHNVAIASTKHRPLSCDRYRTTKPRTCYVVAICCVLSFPNSDFNLDLSCTLSTNLFGRVLWSVREVFPGVLAALFQHETNRKISRKNVCGEIRGGVLENQWRCFQFFEGGPRSLRVHSCIPPLL